MPLKIGNQDIPRIYAGNEKVKRAYQGNELVYGLYDVHYYDRNNIDTYTPKEYAWGYDPECTTLPTPTNAPTYYNQYLTHYGNSSGTNGWYINNSLTTQKSGSINKIDLNDKQDFDFYARWRQHRYSYDGVISYQEWVPGPGPGPDPGEFNPIPMGVEYTYEELSSSSMGYVSDDSVVCDPGQVYQCTWWTAVRLNVLSGGAIKNVWAGTRWWNTYGHQFEPKLGAVGCWSNHVAVVEYITDSGPLFSHGNWGGSATVGKNALKIGGIRDGSGEFLGYVYPFG